jgi:hypothetical protein
MTQLQRLVVEFKPEELIIRALYKTDDAAKLGPNTKARTREVTELTRAGSSTSRASRRRERGPGGGG